MSMVGFGDPASRLAELNTIYLDDKDRYVVSLIVGYTDEDLQPWIEEGDLAPEQAAALGALDLTRDEGAYGTNWFVYDRLTGKMHNLEQRDFDSDMERLYRADDGLDRDESGVEMQERGL